MRYHSVQESCGSTSLLREAGTLRGRIVLPNAVASMVTTAPDYIKYLVAAIPNAEISKEQVFIRPMLGWGLGNRARICLAMGDNEVQELRGRRASNRGRRFRFYKPASPRCGPTIKS